MDDGVLKQDRLAAAASVNLAGLAAEFRHHHHGRIAPRLAEPCCSASTAAASCANSTESRAFCAKCVSQPCDSSTAMRGLSPRARNSAGAPAASSSPRLAGMFSFAQMADV